MKLKILSAFGISILILVLIGVFSYKNISDYRSSSEWVHHTQKVISQTERMLLNVQDIVTEQRGYVITGEEKYLEYYIQGLENVEKSYLSVKELVKDNTAQLLAINAIYETICIRIELSKKAVLLRRTEGFEEAREFASKGKGEEIMKKIRVDVDRFIDIEEEFLSERVAGANDSFSSATVVIITSIILTILIVLVTLYFFILDYNKRIESEKQVVASELRIKKILAFVPETTHSEDEPLPVPKIVNLNFLFKTVSRNKKAMIEIMDVFLEQLPLDLAVLNEAASSEDYTAVKRQSHKMRSSSAMMGINELVNTLNEMENLGMKAENMERIKQLCMRVNELAHKAMEEIAEEKSNYL